LFEILEQGSRCLEADPFSIPGFSLLDGTKYESLGNVKKDAAIMTACFYARDGQVYRACELMKRNFKKKVESGTLPHRHTALYWMVRAIACQRNYQLGSEKNFGEVEKRLNLALDEATKEKFVQGIMEIILLYAGINAAVGNTKDAEAHASDFSCIIRRDFSLENLEQIINYLKTAS
jgi:hypothetical protein